MITLMPLRRGEKPRVLKQEPPIPPPPPPEAAPPQS
jgi:hypothetical protein